MRPALSLSALSASAGGRIKIHSVLESFERVLPSLLEVQPGACDQVFDRPRHENLACRGNGRDSGRNVDCDAPDVVVPDLDLSGMQAAANFDIQRTDGFGYRAGTANCTSRPV